MDSEAELVLQQMVTAQLQPDSYSYLALIKAASNKSGQEAERWLSTAISARVNVDTGMFNAVLRAYVAHSDSWEAKRIYADMERAGVPGNTATFLSVAYAHALEGEVSKVEDFVYASGQAGSGLGREEYSCLLQAYSKKQRYRSHKAERVFREMISQNIMPTAKMLQYLRFAMGDGPAQALLEELRVDPLDAP